MHGKTLKSFFHFFFFFNFVWWKKYQKKKKWKIPSKNKIKFLSSTNPLTSEIRNLYINLNPLCHHPRPGGESQWFMIL